MPGERLSNHIGPILKSGQWSFSARDPFLLKEQMGCGRYCQWLEAGGGNVWPFSSQEPTKERNLPRLLLGVQPFFTSAQNTINRTFFWVVGGREGDGVVRSVALFIFKSPYVGNKDDFWVFLPFFFFFCACTNSLELTYFFSVALLTEL